MILRVVIFYILTFLFTIILGGGQEATGIAAGWLTLPQLAPGLAALVMLALFRRDRLHLSLSPRGVPVGRLLGALALPLAGAAVVYGLLALLGEVGPGVGPDPTIAPLWLLLPGMAIGAFGEELGWRAYLHRRVDPHLAPLVSSALVGTLWALWHVGMYANGPVYMVAFVVLMIAYSVVLYWLLAGQFNVWVATAFHLGINLGSLALLPVINGLPFVVVSALVWVVLAAIVLWRGSERFGRRPREVAASLR